MKWSTYQKNIFREISNTDRSIAVKAVAGSGKTATICEASKKLDFTDRPLFVAFNKSIATELSSRTSPLCETSTFHAIGMSTCIRNLPKITVEQYKYFSIVSAYVDRPVEPFGGLFSSAYPLVQIIDAARCRRAKLSIKGIKNLVMSQGILGVRASSNKSWQDVIDHVKACLKIGLKQAFKQGIIDFTDMVWLPVYKDWDIQPYSTVFVDEVQDLNPVQLSLLIKLVASDGRLIMVGDPNQAIYAFTGAMSESFFVTKETFEAKEMPLSVCYRCPTSHLDLARNFCPSIENYEQAEKGTVDDVSYSSLRYELAEHEGEKLLICRSKAPLIKTFIELLADGVDCQLYKDTILKTLLLLIEVLETDYGASINNIYKKLKEYRDDETIRIQETNPGGGKLAISNLNDNCDALQTLIYAFRVPSIIAFKKKIRGLAKKKGDTLLSTVHGAKGLEANWVGILNWSSMPLNVNGMSREQLKQEPNLQLIATTRSKEHLRFIEIPPDE